jgi:hypothetical protein
VSAPTDLDGERVIRAALALLGAMGGQGLEHHERAFRELEGLDAVILGADRIADHAAGMLVRTDGGGVTLADRVRRENGLRSPRFDREVEELARTIRRARGELLDVTFDVRRRRRVRVSFADALRLGPAPLGPWTRDLDEGEGDQADNVIPFRSNP